jgi:O-antigen/teichoic acid export membrane protein
VKVLKNSLVITVVSLLQRAIGFFLLPLYTSYLGTEDYGTVNVVTSYAAFLGIFCILGLNGAGQRIHFKYPGEAARRELWGTLLIFVLATSLCVVSLLTVLHAVLVDPFLPGIDFWPYAALALLIMGLGPVYSLYQSLLLSQQDGARYSLNAFVYFIVNLALTLVFVVGFRMKAVGVLSATAVTAFAFFLHSLLAFTGEVRWRWSAPLIRESLAYSLPMLPHLAASWAMVFVDRLLLNYYDTTASVGIYSVGLQIANVIGAVTVAFNQAYSPWFLEKMEQRAPGRARVVLFSKFLVVVYGWLALTLSFFAPEILAVMVSSRYHDGWRVVPFVAFSAALCGLYFIFVNPLFIKRTGLVPVVTALSGVSGIVLNLALIPRWGMIGAGISLLGTNVVSSLAALVLSQRYEFVPFEWGKMYAVIGGFFLLSLTVFATGRLGPAAAFAIKLVTVVGIAVPLGVAFRDEIYEAWELIVGARGPATGVADVT